MPWIPFTLWKVTRSARFRINLSVRDHDCVSWGRFSHFDWYSGREGIWLNAFHHAMTGSFGNTLITSGTRKLLLRNSSNFYYQLSVTSASNSSQILWSWQRWRIHCVVSCDGTHFNLKMLVILRFLFFEPFHWRSCNLLIARNDEKDLRK